MSPVPPSVLAPSGTHAPSYYAASAHERVSAPPLTGSVRADFAIVGGGYTGLSAALELARQGARVVLLEQSLVGWGASGRNGGQVHVGLRQDQQWLEARFGAERARSLWQLALDARAHLDALIAGHRIDCDFKSGLLHANHKMSYDEGTRRHVALMNERYGYESLRFVAREEIAAYVATRAYSAGSFDARGGHLHALKLALGIARAAVASGAILHEQSEVTALAREGEDWRLSLAGGELRARAVLLACNGYLRGLSRVVERHVMPINNFVAVTEPLGEARARALIPAGCAVSDSRFVVHYYRLTADHRLLFGGGENYSYRFPRDIAGVVRGHVASVFPPLSGVRFDYAWGGTLAITPNRLPFLREVEPGLFSASGFSGLGVVLAPYAGHLLGRALAGERGASALLESLPVPRFPGGKWLRWPTLVAAMSFYALRDRL
jgi:gamma-glutamylputrescine oxidase